MRKVFSLSQYFLICVALLISTKSFATNCPSSGITTTIYCEGNISTSAEFAKGIYLENFIGTNNSNPVTMFGNITTTGYYAQGIYLYNYLGTNNFNTVTMFGNVTTTGVDAHGIYLRYFLDTNSNNSNRVSMYENVTTAGAYANGIYLDSYLGTNNINTVMMAKNITTTGANANGIYLYNYLGTNNFNTVTMFGNVTTTGANANGIYLDNSSGTNNINTVIMYKNITTTGANANGIYLNNSSGTNNLVNMFGNITTTGANANGIYLNSSGTTNINAVNMYMGRISATGSGSYAIYATNANSTSSNTVWLNKGTSVSGRILGEGAYTANNFLKLNLGAGASYGFALTGFTVTDLNYRPMVIGSAYAAGIGNVVTASQSLYERTSQITQSLDDRLRTYDLEKNTDQPYWINTYYSDSSRGGQGLSGSNLSFNQYRSGITAGFDVKNTFTPTEFIVNYEHGKLNIDEGNQGISSNSIMAGALFPDVVKVFSGTLSAKALVGYSDFSGDRKVLTNDVAYNGSRNVTASYQSTNVTIGSAWTKTLYQTDKIILDTLVGVDLNTQHINSYSESDLFKWSGRTINQLQERVSLGMEIKPMVNPLTLYGRVGIERRDLLSGENQNFAINNTAVSYNDSNQRNTYATLNAGAYYPLTATIKAYAQVRYYDSDKNIDSLSGNIGISGQF